MKVEDLPLAKPNEQVCGTFFPMSKFDINDGSGCLKKEGHNDAHICREKNGNYTEWEDDYECDCGCWDDEDDLIHVCKIYNTLIK